MYEGIMDVVDKYMEYRKNVNIYILYSVEDINVKDGNGMVLGYYNNVGEIVVLVE